MVDCASQPVHRLVRPIAVEDAKADVMEGAKMDVTVPATGHVRVDAKIAVVVINQFKITNYSYKK